MRSNSANKLHCASLLKFEPERFFGSQATAVGVPIREPFLVISQLIKKAFMSIRNITFAWNTSHSKDRLLFLDHSVTVSSFFSAPKKESYNQIIYLRDLIGNS
jgi:hypothetical protein